MNISWLRGVTAGALAFLILASSSALTAQVDKKGEERKTAFEVFQDAKKEWRWRYKAANGAILATPGEGYKARADAMKAIETLKSTADKMKVEFFEDSKGEHRWRLKATNGMIMAVASEGYKRKADAEKGYELFKSGVSTARVADAKGEK